MDDLVYYSKKMELDRPCGLVDDATRGNETGLVAMSMRGRPTQPSGRDRPCGHVDAGNGNYTAQQATNS